MFKLIAQIFGFRKPVEEHTIKQIVDGGVIIKFDRFSSYVTSKDGILYRYTIEKVVPISDEEREKRLTKFEQAKVLKIR